MIWHRHKWIEVERFHAMPLVSIEIEGASAHAVERLTFGVTTIKFECRLCGQDKFKEVLGKSERTISDETA